MQDNVPTTDSSSAMPKRLLRVLVWLIAIAASIALAAYLYSAYQEHKQLTYMTTDKCSEHDYQTQLCETEDESLYLRRIDTANNRMSVSMLVDDAAWDDYKYRYWAFWFESCEEGVEVEAEEAYSGGKSWILSCDTQPNQLLSELAPTRLALELTVNDKAGIKIDSDGFTIDHDYSSTDYSLLQRRLVMTNGQIKEDRKARKLKEAEMEEARRIKKEAAAEQARQKRLALQKNKRECEGRNKQAKQTFDSTVAQAGKTMLEPGALDLLCADYVHSERPLACKSYTAYVYNKSDLPIRSIRLLYGTSKSCSTSGDYAKTINALIAPYSSKPHRVSIDWSAYRDLIRCGKVVDVEFDTIFEPEQC